METFSRPIGINRIDAEKGRPNGVSFALETASGKTSRKPGEGRPLATLTDVPPGDFWEDVSERVWKPFQCRHTTPPIQAAVKFSRQILQDLGYQAGCGTAIEPEHLLRKTFETFFQLLFSFRFSADSNSVRQKQCWRENPHITLGRTK